MGEMSTRGSEIELRTLNGKRKSDRGLRTQFLVHHGESFHHYRGWGFFLDWEENILFRGAIANKYCWIFWPKENLILLFSV